MKKIISARLLLSTTTLLFAGALIAAATFAFLSDTETSQDNEFEAGILDLQIDNTSFYNGALSDNTTWSLDDLEGHLFSNFLDVKPGDWGEDTISIHVINNDAYACFDTAVTSDDDSSSNEPELLTGDPADIEEELFDGELGENLNFAFWVDDGDNVYEEGEELIGEGIASELLDGFSVTLADTLSNLFEDNGPLLGEQTYYIAKAWCFGDLTLNAIGQDGLGSTDTDETDGYNGTNGPDVRNAGIICDGSLLDNSTQTDTLTADVFFTATQSRNNSEFVCEEPEPTPPPVVACEVENAIYAINASGFADNDQGLRKDGSSVLANRSIPSAAFGAPQTSGSDSDAGFPVGSFFSLGFPLEGNTASIVFTFAEPFYPNPGGDDLMVFEVTGGTYPDEKVKIEASQDGISWTLLAAAATRDEGVEISPLPWAQYVRLTDVSNIADPGFPADADGYDVDALKAFCTEVDNQLNLPEIDG